MKQSTDDMQTNNKTSLREHLLDLVSRCDVSNNGTVDPINGEAAVNQIIEAVVSALPEKPKFQLPRHSSDDEMMWKAVGYRDCLKDVKQILQAGHEQPKVESESE